MSGLQAFEGGGGGVDDNGQLVIQVVSGSGGNGAGSIGVDQSFHNWMVAGDLRVIWDGGRVGGLESAKNKKVFV